MSFSRAFLTPITRRVAAVLVPFSLAMPTGGPAPATPAAELLSALPLAERSRLADVVLAGPPWISIEHPVNPYDATTRSAFLVVHAFHHGTATGFPVSGTAEGLVNGQRRSIPLTFTGTSRTGAYALTKQWPSEGTWTLLIWATQGRDDRVTAVVELGPTGEVALVRVPTRTQDRWTIPAAVAMDEVERSLRVRASQLAAAR